MSFYEHFTDRARKVMQLAKVAANQLNHPFIDPIHILMGLYNESDGIASYTLKPYIKSAEELRVAVISMLPIGQEARAFSGDKLPNTPATQEVIQNAINESKRLGSKHIGTEHLLLGILTTTDPHVDTGLRLLKALAVDIDTLHKRILCLIGPVTILPVEKITENTYLITIPDGELNGMERLIKTLEELESTDEYKITSVIVTLRKLE